MSMSASDSLTPIAIAVVEHDNGFLVGRRTQGKPLAGMLEFPGGKIELGETPAEAAVRECREETGLTVRAKRLLGETTHSYDHGGVRLFFVACEPVDAPPTPSGYQWLARQALNAEEFPPANRELIERLRSDQSSLS